MAKIVTTSLALLVIFFSSSCNGPSKDSTEGIAEPAIDPTIQYTVSRTVQSGAFIYAGSCESCHGKDLRGTEGGPSLIGEVFVDKWKDKHLDSLFELTRTTMPKSSPNSLSEKSYASLLAYILDANGYSARTISGLDNHDSSRSMAIGLPVFEPKDRAQLIPATSGIQSIEGDWRQHRSDYASTNYSPLDQINKSNVKDLKVVWRWKTDNFGPRPEYYFKSTPIMANGVLFTTAGRSRSVAAIDCVTGETLWMFRLDEKERLPYVPRQNSGRGVAYWTAPRTKTDRVVFITPGFQLVALDARSGQPVEDFGSQGIIDLKKTLGYNADATIGSTSPPIIVNDVIVVGSCFPVGLAPKSKSQVRGDIMGFDASTRKHLWTFHTIPQQGEEGNETWKQDSWKYTGNTGAWAPLTADPSLGYVYLPIEAATGDFFGGSRPGNNLFSQSLVCVDVKTGKKVWHYQLVHHDIWDYDLAAPPILADIKVGEKAIKAVVQVTKQAFAFVFDRVTGEPVWPIEERPVPKSSVESEWTSPTQPIPTRPAPFDRQGYSDDIVVDYTPQIKKEALRIASHYSKGPIYTPVAVEDSTKTLGTLILPDAVGGANWQGGVLDPETGVLYVSSSTVLRPMVLRKSAAPSDMEYIAIMGAANIGPYGLPLVKPPYGRITAIDLNTGDHKWMVANADTPQWIKDLPALKGVNIPRTGTPDRVGMLLTKTLLFAGEGSGLYGTDGGGGNKFHAYDKTTGEIISTLELPANQAGIPMTYSVNGKQYIIIAVGADDHAGELIALSL
ncbi:PQQ-binding-like beta-propeller repeat protein [Chryseolinea sp. T2]|uniref:outer membrane protein assembly factor BamB family protein n=1 Tax=Chryseolinea sp. T2 TaxID=3129255 RepID=UPI0030786DBD